MCITYLISLRNKGLLDPNTGKGLLWGQNNFSFQGKGVDGSKSHFIRFQPFIPCPTPPCFCLSTNSQQYCNRQDSPSPPSSSWTLPSPTGPQTLALFLPAHFLQNFLIRTRLLLLETAPAYPLLDFILKAVVQKKKNTEFPARRCSLAVVFVKVKTEMTTISL